MDSHYKIYQHGSPVSEVKATNYYIGDGFVTFFISVPGIDNMNVASYPTQMLAKIEYCNDPNKVREEKLKRLTRKHNIFKRFLNLATGW